ncbi:MAG: carbohydrate ABC transporter permease [Thermotoga sp.]|nr:MAG: carbohydrate ABC transporter permease [Thermotoga sp.]HDM70202.1 carbohydrate ABC transporter permease [Thermotogales bacterium]
MMRKRKKPILLLFKYLLLSFVSFFTLLPLIWMISTSLEPDKGLESYSLIPKEVTFRNYVEAWNYPKLYDPNVTLGTMFLNSIIVSSIITVLSLLFDSMAGYSLARKRFPGRNFLFWLALSTLMIPFYVVVIPMYLITMKLGLINTLTGLIIPFISSGFGVFLFRQTFLSIPLELEEAARIDGAGDLFIYWKIMLPLVKPTIATMAIFKVLWSWNMFFWPLLIIQDYSKMPINLGLTIFRGQYVTKWGLLTAGMIIATLPIIILFLTLQKWFIRGLTAGALKG